MDKCQIDAVNKCQIDLHVTTSKFEHSSAICVGMNIKQNTHISGPSSCLQMDKILKQCVWFLVGHRNFICLSAYLPICQPMCTCSSWVCGPKTIYLPILSVKGKIKTIYFILIVGREEVQWPRHGRLTFRSRTESVGKSTFLFVICLHVINPLYGPFSTDSTILWAWMRLKTDNHMHKMKTKRPHAVIMYLFFMWRRWSMVM